MVSDENEIKVKEILKDAYKHPLENVVLYNDLQKQEDEFQKKLQEKRMKKIVLSHDVTFESTPDVSISLLRFQFR
jgi:hypothetical protein